MEFNVEGMGIIFNIDTSKFVADGTFYLIEDYNEQSDTDSQISLISSSIKDLFFESKVQKLINEVNDNASLKSVDYRNSEIYNWFSQRNGRKLDLIMFTDTGLRGTDKVNMEENSIIYFKISDCLKLGFFINKMMANIIFGQMGDKINVSTF